jgi:hypothetical protein
MGRTLLALTCAACAAPANGDPRPARTAPDDYEQHVAALRERLGDRLGPISIRVEAPFVVVGDTNDATLARESRTVRWAADHLEHDFFGHRPAKILDVYLFHGARSYEHGVETLTGSAPDTPYGFYSKTHGGLFMNIATGGGTLVHELVHPYVEADFPDAPPWLNEGLGSLFEQSAERDGHIVGLTNWRLAGLQKALARGAVPSFRTLAAMNADAFYDDDSGVHYATARYLLFYLQDRGIVREFYRAFRAARSQDPTGYATLVATLGEKDMDSFRARWEKFVSGLSFP